MRPSLALCGSYGLVLLVAVGATGAAAGGPVDEAVFVPGEPHILGFNGAEFDFHGRPGAVFNLISTPSSQVNAALSSELADGFTYIDALGVRTATANIKVFVHENHIRVSVGDLIVSRAFVQSNLRVTLSSDTTAVIETVDLRLTIALRDGRCLEVTEATLLHTVDRIDGVLGRTALEGALHDADATYKGEDADYYVSDLWARDFAHNVFSASQPGPAFRRKQPMSIKEGVEGRTDTRVASPVVASMSARKYLRGAH